MTSPSSETFFDRLSKQSCTGSKECTRTSGNNVAEEALANCPVFAPNIENPPRRHALSSSLETVKYDVSEYVGHVASASMASTSSSRRHTGRTFRLG
jgi:hypothetical protein